MKGWWAVVAAMGLVGAVERSDDSRSTLIKNYRSWKKVTEAPVDMSMALAASCIGPTRWDRSDNPHVPKAFLVYVNKIGEKAMMVSGKTIFPDGTVIVKEKYDRSDLTKGESHGLVFYRTVKDGAKPILLTVMAKKDGVWSYFAVDGSGKVIEGDSASCAKCHEANKENDFAFRSYVRGAPLAPRPWN
ncbi:MAG TPA: cytochrome P460 family protein [Fimbriimonas sp.]|nr:cytochrome P460 family protein [Fimbriimonas sp.]